MKEYCNICGRELLEDVLVVDTSLDMKPIKFKEKFYVFKEATTKPGGPKVDFKEICLDDKYICSTCFSEIMNPEGDEED